MKFQMMTMCCFLTILLFFSSSCIPIRIQCDYNIQYKIENHALKCLEQPDKIFEFEITNENQKVQDLPAYFSWKDVDGKDYTTPAKDQGKVGSCFAFAAIATLESVIEIRED